MKAALAAVCILTGLATAYLSASLVVLRPPRADYQQWAVVATLIVAQGVLTLVALFAAGSAALRWVVLAGGLLIGLLGARSISSTVSGPHFEGYALVLGSMLIVQGALTVATVRPKPDATAVQR
jgi:hypothetical protein